MTTLVQAQCMFGSMQQQRLHTVLLCLGMQVQRLPLREALRMWFSAQQQIMPRICAYTHCTKHWPGSSAPAADAVHDVGLQAMAAGLPVIAVAAGGLLDIVTQPGVAGANSVWATAQCRPMFGAP
jgi:hypothetical protein